MSVADNLRPKRLVMIIPVVTTILIFASISGIIGNSILLADTGDTRSFTINDLEVGEIVDRQITYGDFQEPEIEVVLNNLGFNSPGDFDNLRISIFLAEDSLPNGITNQSQLVASDFYQDEVFDESSSVSGADNFYLTDNIEPLTLIFANVGDQSVSFQVTIRIQDGGIDGFANTGRILGIIFSALLTAFFLGTSIYLWLEFFEKIQVRFLTQDLEDRMDEFLTKAQSWEVMVIVVAIIMSIVGYVQLLYGVGTGVLVPVVIGIVVVYSTYTKRVKIEDNIKRILNQERQIHLEALSDMIGEQSKDVKKILLDMIMYSDFSANYDFKSEMVTYNPEGGRQPQTMVEDEPEPVQEGSFNVASTESRVIEEEGESPSRPMPRCAYCDEEAINVNAQFCHNCGASMSSAK